MAKKFNCDKNGKKYFRLVITLGKDLNGNAIRKEFYGESKKDAENKRDSFLQDYYMNLTDEIRELTVGKLTHIYLFEILRNSEHIKLSTFQRYESLARNYILSSPIANIKLSDIKSLEIQRYYNDLYGLNKSSNIIRCLHIFLGTVFTYAVNQEFMLKNPCSKGKLFIPGKDKLIVKEDSLKYFKPNEITVLLDSLKGHKLETLIKLCLTTGLRQGEVLALTKKDFDFKNKILKINKTLKRVKVFEDDKTFSYKYLVYPPKSQTSNRTIPLPEYLIKELKSYINNKKLMHLKNGVPFDNDSFVFTTDGLKVMESRNLQRAWQRLLKGCNLEYKKFHSLRHTFASYLLEKGIDMKTISELLGHSDICITMNTYTHSFTTKKVTAIDEISNFVSSI